jgi:hypothetical protein
MKPATLFDKVEKVLCDQYRCSLGASPQKDAYFRALMDVDLDGSLKPLLIVGSTHPDYYGDGTCFAVLNPDESLLDTLEPGVGYGGTGLKDRVRGKCDLTLELWINTIGGFRTTRTCQYRSRRLAPPRVPWRIQK